MAELLLGVLEHPEVLRVDAEVDVPVPALLQPVLVPLLIGSWLDEELHLHLLELAGPEDEVARGDLVAEALAGLADAERRLLSGGVHDIEVVDEDALCGLRAEVVERTGILDRAHRRAQHPVEVPGLGELALGAAVRAGDVGETVRGFMAVLLGVELEQLICTPPLVAFLALGQRVDEGIDVAGGDPHLRGEDDRGVDADDVVTPPDHRLPPLPADILLEFDPIGAVVPGRAAAAVDLRGLEDEPATLAQVDDGIDAIGGHLALLF